MCGSYFENTSFACKATYESLLSKKECIGTEVDEIESLVSKLELSDTDKLKNEICDSIYKTFISFCENIYSSMEYMGYIIYIYQRRSDAYRGMKLTESSFNKTLKFYNKNREEYKIFNNKEFEKEIKDISTWYPVIRDIRSKEVHYNKGIISIDGNSIKYKNDVEYGEHLANELELNNIKGYYTKFKLSVDSILNIVNNYEL